MPAPGERLTSAQRGYGSKWQRYREGYIARNPLCIFCKAEGKVAATKVVDHIIPPRLKEALASGIPERITKAQSLFWDPNNHQPLCESCHDGPKQRFEKSGTVAGCDQSGVPLDAKHHWNTNK